LYSNQPLQGVSRNISLAFSQNVQCNHFATGPGSKPRSKIPRVVRTERPAPTHTCWVSSPEPAFYLSRRTPPLGHSFVKSCGNFILAGGGVPKKVLYGGDFATSSTPEVGAGAQRRALLWSVALHRQILHPVHRAAPSLADVGLLRHAAHLIWLKQNYKSVSEPQPTARLPPSAHREPSPLLWDRSPAWCCCHRRS